MGKRIKKLKKINRLAIEGIKEKYKMAKEDKRHIALVAVELLLILMLVMSLVFLFDPAHSFPGSEKIPWPLKLLLFFGGTAIAFKLYSYTKDFRFKEV